MFICTHSAEILSSALHQNNCSVFHLRTSRDITPVDRKDEAELFDILRRLGLSSMDVLSWQGTIFVEGEDNIELLPLGFPELLSSFQIKELGGRAEIEKDVRRLQEAENVEKFNASMYLCLIMTKNQPTWLAPLLFEFSNGIGIQLKVTSLMRTYSIHF